MSYIQREDIEQLSWRLLEETDGVRIPVPVDVVATRLGIGVEAAPLGTDVSGVLVLDNGVATIGYNDSHSYNRQRFSIAHEVGHWALHRNEADAPGVFIDTTKYVAVYLRDGQSSTGSKEREIQANMFAASFIMPEPLILAELQKSEYDEVDEEELCRSLAGKFQVSEQAMSIRLATLGILNPH